MKITGKTKITGLFGYPVEHTLSPAMHNAAFEHLGLDYCYLPFLVHPEHLGQAIDAVRALNMAGVNITVPHKENVRDFLDTIDNEARFIGAVNTIVNRDGSLSGYNTDGRGFMRSLEEEDISVKGKHVIIVGSGGACRAISYYLSEQADKLTLFDIDKQKVRRLADDLSQMRSNIAVADTVSLLDGYDVIVNATPLGLKKDDPLPFDTSKLGRKQVVCDLIYKKTPTLEAAEKSGAKIMNGLGMLLWQGVLAFELWTGILPPSLIMKNALLANIK